jgi:hypothetical protein
MKIKKIREILNGWSIFKEYNIKHHETPYHLFSFFEDPIASLYKNSANVKNFC